MSKVQVLDSCLKCGYCEWIKGKPRCKHPSIKMKKPEHEWDDGLLFPMCYTDGTQDIRNDCPLINIESIEKLTEIIDFYEKHHARIENFPFITNIRNEQK